MAFAAGVCCHCMLTWIPKVFGQSPAQSGHFPALAHQTNLLISWCVQSGVLERENRQAVQESSSPGPEFPTPAFNRLNQSFLLSVYMQHHIMMHWNHVSDTPLYIPWPQSSFCGVAAWTLNLGPSLQCHTVQCDRLACVCDCAAFCVKFNISALACV